VRNILFLIQRYWTFFIFLILQLICFSLIIKNNSHQHSSFINSTKGFTGGLFKNKEKFKNYFLLREKNEELLKENTILKNKLGIQIPVNTLKDTNYSKEIAFNDSTKQTVFYKYIPATVVNNIIDQRYNFITLSKGSKDGITKNMSVIGPSGTVGKITNTSEHYSIVSSIISDQFNSSAQLKDGTIGKINWDKKDIDYLTLSGIPQHVKILPGDSIYTSGYSVFPANILIGRAAAIERSNTSGLSNYRIKLATNFRNIHHVYIVEDVTTLERKKLEDSSIIK
jgi:rod shape-determining protein MreC